MVITNEAKVGIFTFLALIILLVALMLTNSIRVGIQGYYLNVRYSFVNDLREGAPVVIAGGVRIGHAQKITINGNQLNVRLWINKKYPLDRTARFIIFTSGLMGDKYIEVEVETPSGQYYSPNEVIDGINPLSIDGLSIKIGNTLNSLFGGAMDSKDFQKSFVYIFKNTSELMYELNQTVRYSQPEFQKAVKSFSDSLTIFREQLVTIMGSLNASSKGLEKMTAGNADKINDAIENLHKASVNLNAASVNFQAIALNAKDITDAIKNKQGTVGRLIYDKDLYNTIAKSAKNFEVFTEKIKQNPKAMVW
jgi:phospholipid/cholesterol/gamma-HCH transport system substrate-binding protein